jgi:hypothetical protein
MSTSTAPVQMRPLCLHLARAFASYSECLRSLKGPRKMKVRCPALGLGRCIEIRDLLGTALHRIRMLRFHSMQTSEIV